MVAVRHERTRGPLHGTWWSDRVAQSQRRAPSQGERDATITVKPVIAGRSVHGEV